MVYLSLCDYAFANQKRFSELNKLVDGHDERLGAPRGVGQACWALRPEDTHSISCDSACEVSQQPYGIRGVSGRIS